MAVISEGRHVVAGGATHWCGTVHAASVARSEKIRSYPATGLIGLSSSLNSVDAWGTWRCFHTVCPIIWRMTGVLRSSSLLHRFEQLRTLRPVSPWDDDSEIHQIQQPALIGSSRSLHSGVWNGIFRWFSSIEIRSRDRTVHCNPILRRP